MPGYLYSDDVLRPTRQQGARRCQATGGSGIMSVRGSQETPLPANDDLIDTGSNSVMLLVLFINTSGISRLAPAMYGKGPCLENASPSTA